MNRKNPVYIALLLRILAVERVSASSMLKQADENPLKPFKDGQYESELITQIEAKEFPFNSPTESSPDLALAQSGLLPSLSSLPNVPLGAPTGSPRPTHVDLGVRCPTCPDYLTQSEPLPNVPLDTPTESVYHIQSGLLPSKLLPPLPNVPLGAPTDSPRPTYEDPGAKCPTCQDYLTQSEPLSNVPLDTPTKPQRPTSANPRARGPSESDHNPQSGLLPSNPLPPLPNVPLGAPTGSPRPTYEDPGVKCPSCSFAVSELVPSKKSPTSHEDEEE